MQPGGEVTDLRTEVTGVTAADLEGVTTTRDEVRAAVLDAIRRLAAAGRPVSCLLEGIRPSLRERCTHPVLMTERGACFVVRDKRWQVRRRSSTSAEKLI